MVTIASIYYLMGRKWKGRVSFLCQRSVLSSPFPNHPPIDSQPAQDNDEYLVFITFFCLHQYSWVTTIILKSRQLGSNDITSPSEHITVEIGIFFALDRKCSTAQDLGRSKLLCSAYWIQYRDWFVNEDIGIGLHGVDLQSPCASPSHDTYGD